MRTQTFEFLFYGRYKLEFGEVQMHVPIIDGAIRMGLWRVRPEDKELLSVNVQATNPELVVIKRTDEVPFNVIDEEVYRKWCPRPRKMLARPAGQLTVTHIDGDEWKLLDNSVARKNIQVLRNFMGFVLYAASEKQHDQ